MTKFGFLSAWAGLALMFAAPSYAHTPSNNGHDSTPKMRVLPVSASAEVSSEPDKATVTAAVITEGKNATEVAAENAAKMTAVYAAMTRAGLTRSDIKTSQLSLTPRYDYESRKKPRIVGYEANNTVTVNTNDLSKVSDIVDSLVQSGVNNIRNVQFSLSDPDSVEALVLDQAIKKARGKAQAIAASAGVTLGALQSLTIDGVGYSPHNQRYDQVIVTAQKKGGGFSSGGVKAGTPISYGEHKIKKTVHLVYEMK